jgi:hypothetical protein
MKAKTLPPTTGVPVPPGQTESWNMPGGEPLGGTPMDMNSLHTAPAAGGAKGHERELNKHAVVHAPTGNPPTLTKDRSSKH